MERAPLASSTSPPHAPALPRQIPPARRIPSLALAMVTGRGYESRHMEFQLVSDYQPEGDQAQAIAKLAKSLEAGNRHQTLLGVTGSGKTFTMANLIAASRQADADHEPQQDARRAALLGVQELLPAQRGRVFRLLLRLLSAGSLHPAQRHLHREGLVDQRRDRAAAPEHDGLAADPAGHDRGRLRFLHLRLGLAGGL